MAHHAGDSGGSAGSLPTPKPSATAISGNGKMKMNGETFAVKPGDAILTRPGSSHSIEPNEGNDLTILIVYEKK